MSNDVVDILRRIRLQKEYCWSHGFPYFASSEFCTKCFSDVYAYVNDEEAANTLITSCPVCHRSFTD